MISSLTAPADARTATVTPDLPLVALTPDPPAWLRAWCQASARTLEVRADPLVGRPGPPFGSELSHAVGALAGRTVWVAREPGIGPVPRRVLVAVRDLAEDAAVLAEAAALGRHLCATLVVAHAVPVAFAERSVGLDTAVDQGRRTLARATAMLARHVPDLPPTVSRLVRTRPCELVAESLDADLLVLGGPRSQASGLGVTLNSALHHAPCPVLLVPRTVVNDAGL